MDTHETDRREAASDKAIKELPIICNADRIPALSGMHTLDRIIVDFMKEQQIPGGAFALSYKGKLIYKQGYGKASFEREVQPDSLFRIASVSKTLTAIGILKLVEQEQIKLASTVFGPKGILSNYRRTAKGDRRLHQITVHHLLQHSAGWDRDRVGDAVFWNLDKVVRKKEATAQDTTLRYMMSKKLQFAPGKRHSYSNLGYLVLGKVIEQITGLSYENFMKGLLSQLDIHNMVVGSNSPSYCTKDEVEYYHNPSPNSASFDYSKEFWMPAHSKSVVMDGTAAYGGWVATTSSLVHIYDSLAGYGLQQLLKEKTSKTMLDRPTYEHGPEWYGLGMDVEDNGLSWSHTGAMEGTSCTVMHEKSGLTWALYFNAWSKDMDLNGLVKYAISTVSSLPLRQESINLPHKYLSVISEDQTQGITVMLPLINLKEHVRLMSEAGYNAQWINCCKWNAENHFNIIWNQDNEHGSFHIMINIKSNRFEETNQRQSENGYFIKHLENYSIADEVYFAIVFKKQPNVVQKVFHHQNPEEHLCRLDKMQEHGFHLVIQSLTSVNGSLVVSSVYEKAELSEKTVSWTAITVDNFLFELNKQIQNNSSLVYVKFFNDGEDPLVSAIWNSKTNNNYWQRNGVSRYGFLYELKLCAVRNRKMDYLSAYVEDGAVNFAAFWPCKTDSTKSSS